MTAKTKPAENAFVITKSDTVNLAQGGSDITTRGLYVGVSGDISVEMADNHGDEKTVLFIAVPAGVLPIAITRVNSTNTDATDMIALY